MADTSSPGQAGTTPSRANLSLGLGIATIAGFILAVIVVAVQRELGVPVKFVGLGEGADDLAPFDPEDFVDALLD